MVTLTCWSFNFYEVETILSFAVLNPVWKTHFSVLAEALLHSILVAEFYECHARTSKVTLRKLDRRNLSQKVSH